MRRVFVVVIALLALTGCAVPWLDDDNDEGAASATRDRDLAARPEELPPDDPAATAGTAPTGPSTTGVGGSPTTAPPGDTTSTTGATADDPARPPRTLVALADPSGDHGIQGPDWADLRNVELVDTGAGSVRTTIVMGGAIPRQLEDREAAGIGIDLYLSGGAESDYQLFLEGSVDGWFAYLDAPRGLVEFPGTFQLGPDRFVVTVSWDSVGGRQPGELRVFADWSTAELVAVAVSSEDHLPDTGRAAYGFSP